LAKGIIAYNFFINYLYILIRVFLYLALDWYFFMYTPERIYCSKNNYHIVLNKKIIKDDVKFHCNIKKVIEVIINLLKDKVKVNNSSDSKRIRMKKFIKE
jgi:hypothetical protein